MAILKALDETLADLRDTVIQNILSLQDLLTLIDEFRTLLLPELPDVVIQHILSFLPLKDAGRASCVSKTWLNAWQTRPILDLDEDVCYLNPRNRGREGFLNYGNHTLQRYREEKIGIEKFTLRFRTPFVSEWIQVALENGVKELKLVSGSHRKTHDSITDLVLPGIIFEAAKSPLSLTVEGNYYYSQQRLKLPKCMIQCQHVKSLHLHYLHFDNSDLQKISSSFPMAEELLIWDCTGFDSFKVGNLYKLKKISFSSREFNFSDKTVEVEAPNLESLHCSGFRSDQLKLSMSASQNLKELQFFNLSIPDEFFLDFPYRFPLLEDLTISGCSCFRRIRLSSVSLKRMYLSTTGSEKEVDIDAPNMTRFELFNWEAHLEMLQIDASNMTYFEYIGNLMSNVSFTSFSNHCCSHICLKEFSKVHATSFFVDLKEFLKNLSQSKIYLHIDYSFEVNDEMYLDSSSVAVPIHQLMFSSFMKEKFLDGLLWSCHPKNIRVIGSLRKPSSASKCDKKLASFMSRCLTRNQDGYNKLREWSVIKQMKFQEYVKGSVIEHALELEMKT